MRTQAERIASVEVRIKSLEEKVNEMDRKLDELLALRYKGAGAFWLASALVGTGIMGAIYKILEWVKG
jgi:hypothetical protein